MYLAAAVFSLFLVAISFIWLRPHLLMQAVDRGDLRAVSRWVRWGAPVDGLPSWLVSPLESAIIQEQPAIVDWLIAHGAALNTGPVGGPLAAAAGKPTMIRQLLAAGAAPTPSALIRTAAIYRFAAEDGNDQHADDAIECVEVLAPLCPQEWLIGGLRDYAERWAERGHGRLAKVLVECTGEASQ